MYVCILCIYYTQMNSIKYKKETKDRNCLYDKYLNIHITHRQTIRPVN